MTQLFVLVFRSLLGLGYWPHARCRGSISIIGGAPWNAAQRGVELSEATIFINVRRFEARYFPEVNEKLPDNAGETIAKALSAKFSREVTCEGESIGAVTHAMVTVWTFANDVNDFGDGTGGLYFDEATVSQERAGWRSCNIRVSSNPGLA